MAGAVDVELGMIARFALLVVGVLALSVTAWYVNDEFVAEPEPSPVVRPTQTPTPSQVDKLLAFCDKARNTDNPLCKVDPTDKQAVDDAVERIVQQAPPQIERSNDDDDDDDNRPEVNVVVPRQTTPASRPSPPPEPTRTTQPPIVRDIVIPDIPELPPVELPELPLLNP